MNTHSTRIFRIGILLLLGLLVNLNVFAGGHLYTSLGGGGNSDIIMSHVNVPYITARTYYEVIGFGSSGTGDGSGYGGIQATSNSTSGNNFIFALWDTQNHLPIKSVYAYPNSTVENFGGEGTGMHILNYSIGWVANDWINFVSRTWNYLGHTYYGVWAFNINRNTWYHIITFDYPVKNLGFAGSNVSFIEDWTGDLQYGRAMNLKEGWNRNAATKKWNPWIKGSFDHNNPDPYKKKYDWGISGDHFFMNTGGTYSPSTTQTAFTLPASGTNPTLTIGQVKSATLNYNPTAKQLKVTWVNDDSKSPQFTYVVEVFNNPNCTGTPVLIKQDTTPHLRTITLNTTNLSNGTYYVRNSMTDIFDQKSNSVINSFVIGGSTGINTIDEAENIVTLYPNPCQEKVNLIFTTGDIHEATLFVYDVSGRIVISGVTVTANQHTLDVSTLRTGLYFIDVCDRNKNTLQRLKLIKQ